MQQGAKESEIVGFAFWPLNSSKIGSKILESKILGFHALDSSKIGLCLRGRCNLGLPLDSSKVGPCLRGRYVGLCLWIHQSLGFAWERDAWVFAFGFIKAWALLEREIPSWVLALDSSKLGLCLRGRYLVGFWLWNSSKLGLCLRGRHLVGFWLWIHQSLGFAWEGDVIWVWLWIPSNVELYFVWGLPKINKKTHAAFVCGTSPEKGGRKKKKKPICFFLWVPKNQALW